MYRLVFVVVLVGGMMLPLTAQPPGGFGPPGGPGGFGGPPGMGGQERKLLKEYDKDQNGYLDQTERKVAREALKTNRPDGFGGFGGFGGGKGGKGGFGGPGGPGGFGKGGEAPKPGIPMAPKDVKNYPDSKFYDTSILRTIFLEFENKDWESELEDFHNSDVEVPATMIVDGKSYKLTGVHFRGMSSYMGVRAGSKRSLNISVDMVNKDQRLYGYKTLNLLNAHEDASMMSTVIYSHIARQYIPAPKANFVRVVINGENWGIYTNVQQFNKEFLEENYKSTKGTRWKVNGSPNGQGGLEYLGDDVNQYKRRYEIKGGENEKAWKALVNFCKVLNTTPASQLEEALKPLVDLDELLNFLALDVALINCDGYWIRASDYSIYLDEKGKFHLIPHDMNEAFRPAMGPGMGGMGGPGGGGKGPRGGGMGGPGGGFPGGGFPGGPGGEGFPPPGGPGGPMIFALPKPGEVLPGHLQEMLELTEEQKKEIAALQKEVDSKLAKILTPEQKKQLAGLAPPMGGFGGFPLGGPGGGGGGVELDPLVGLNESRKPLRSKLLVVPSIKKKYLDKVRTIAEKSLDWKVLGPEVAKYRELIAADVERDTHKLESYASFQRATADDATSGRGREFPIRAFADQRRKYLLEWKEGTPVKR